MAQILLFTVQITINFSGKIIDQNFQEKSIAIRTVSNYILWCHISEHTLRKQKTSNFQF